MAKLRQIEIDGSNKKRSRKRSPLYSPEKKPEAIAISLFHLSVIARELKWRCLCGFPRVPRDTPNQSRFWPGPAQAHPARPAEKSGLNLNDQSRPAASPNRPGPRAGSNFSISKWTWERTLMLMFAILQTNRFVLLTVLQLHNHLFKCVSDI